MTIPPTLKRVNSRTPTPYTASSRKWIAEGSDMYVKEFTLIEREEVPWHSHSEMFGVFFCLEKRMGIEHIGIFSDPRRQHHREVRC